MICYLCDNENAKPLQRGGEALLHYIECPNCGGYIISEQAIITHANKRDTRFIVAGEAFQLFYYRNEIKKILISDFETSEDIPTIEKLYHLARYFYAETLKNGLGQKIKSLPRACCYAKDNSEYFQLWELLKSKNIINFEKSIASPGDDRVMYMFPTFTTEAKLLFDEKIKTLDDFKELVMGEKKEPNRIAITTFNGQLNNANGNAIINAVQNNNSQLQEILKFLDELEKHIPHDISKGVKDQVDESIDTIKAELQSPQPKINVIKTLVIGLKGLVNAAGFTAAAITILEFIDKLPK